MRVLTIEEVTEVSGGLGICNRFQYGKMTIDFPGGMVSLYEGAIDFTSYVFERMFPI